MTLVQPCAPTSPSVIGPEYAAVFGRAKEQLVTADGIVQTGGVYLDDENQGPELGWPRHVTTDEPLIETFVVAADGCIGTGADAGLIEAWRPTVETMTRRVLAAATELDIALTGDAYLTATVTPSDQVTGLPHFDDDQFVVGAGVGLVAIVGDVMGPRIATTPLAQLGLRPGGTLVTGAQLIEDFEAGVLPQQHVAADRIVVFPQFGQLHAGPVVADPDPTVMRYLMVLRVATAPGAREAS